MKERRLNEIKGVIMVAMGFMVLASLIRLDGLDLSFYTSHPNIPPKNLLGRFGAMLGGIIVFLFGRPTSFVMPLLILLLGIKFFRQKTPYLSIPRILGILTLLLSMASLIGMLSFLNEPVKFYYAGFLGALISNFITSYFGRLGGFIIFITFIILSMALVTEILISSLFIILINNTKSALRSIFRYSRKEKAFMVKVKSTSIKEPTAVNEKRGPIIAEAKPKITVSDALLSKPKIKIEAKPLAPEPKAKERAPEL